MATLHLIVGLPLSGKSTYARALAEKTGALLLSPDPWQLAIVGDDSGSPEHDRRHDTIERIQWEIAAHVLPRGVDVILDFGFWSREERDDMRARARALGAEFKIHFMDVDEPELFRRLKERSRYATGAFVIPDDEMRAYIALFERPAEDELA